MARAPFAPDAARLYEVAEDGSVYTEAAPPGPPAPAGRAGATLRAARRWWVAAVGLNALAAGIAGLGAALLPASAAAWLGLLPLATAPALLVPPALEWRARGGGVRRAPRSRRHRVRPGDFGRAPRARDGEAGPPRRPLRGRGA